MDNLSDLSDENIEVTGTPEEKKKQQKKNKNQRKKRKRQERKVIQDHVDSIQEVWADKLAALMKEVQARREREENAKKQRQKSATRTS